MRKYCIAVILVLFFTVVTSHAQDLTETEVVETMNRALNSTRLRNMMKHLRRSCLLVRILRNNVQRKKGRYMYAAR